MATKHVLSAAAAALLLAGTGLAQAQQAAAPKFDPTGLHEAKDDDAVVPGINRSVDDVEDMDLVGANGDEIGDVEEVLVDATNQPVAVVVDAGGFLGIGDRSVVIGLDRLQLNGDKLGTSMTKEDIEALPEWDND